MSVSMSDAHLRGKSPSKRKGSVWERRIVCDGRSPRVLSELGVIAVDTGRVTTGRKPGVVKPWGVRFSPVMSNGVSERNGKVSQ